MTTPIFQVSDLAGSRRTEFIEAARGGRARMRDKDGTSLVMLRESQLELLESLARWSQALVRLEALLRRDTVPTVAELGELAWLRPFGLADLREFVEELNDVLISAYADREASVVEQCLHAWRVTARQLEDPLRKAVLLGRSSPSDFVDAPRPNDDRA